MSVVVLPIVIVSRSFDDAYPEAVRFITYNNSEGIGEVARFRVGESVYDPREESKRRWINYDCVAFNNDAAQIKDMRITEGSIITIIGHLDESKWDDEKGKHRKLQVVVDKLEYVPYKRKDRKNGSAEDQDGLAE